jgi:hypothetical protein
MSKRKLVQHRSVLRDLIERGESEQQQHPVSVCSVLPTSTIEVLNKIDTDGIRQLF